MVSVLLCFTAVAAQEINFIDVSDQKQLILGDRFIADSANIEITMNSPIKLGPVVKTDKPWEEFRLTSYFTCVQDGDVAKMYYSSFWKDQWNFQPNERVWFDHAYYCYAESKDGINWTKPNLGIVDFEGSTNNNIVEYLHDHTAEKLASAKAERTLIGRYAIFTPTV